MIFIMSKMGTQHTHLSANAQFNVAGMFTRGWVRPPHVNWSLLFGRKQISREPASKRTVTGEVLPPLE